MKKLVLTVLISCVYLCDAGLICKNSSEPLKAASEEFMHSNKEPKAQCGITFGGADNKYREFPWLVVLFVPRFGRDQCALEDNICWSFSCGASLISWKVALTGRTCADSSGKQKARVGDWNLDIEEPLPYQERYVTKTIIDERHQASQDEGLRYDLALIIVESPFTLADNVGFICLPPPDLDVTSASCKAADIRYGTDGIFDYQQVWNVDNMDYMNHDQCQRTLRQTRRHDVVLHDSFVCARATQDYICLSKGGSPFMCLADNRYYARGVSSYSIGCSRLTTTGFFTDIVKVRSWIDGQMKANGFNTDTYTYSPK